MERGAEIEAREEANKTRLNLAERNDSTETAKLLLGSSREI